MWAVILEERVGSPSVWTGFASYEEAKRWGLKHQTAPANPNETYTFYIVPDNRLNRNEITETYRTEAPFNVLHLHRMK